MSDGPGFPRETTSEQVNKSVHGSRHGLQATKKRRTSPLAGTVSWESFAIVRLIYGPAGGPPEPPMISPGSEILERYSAFQDQELAAELLGNSRHRMDLAFLRNKVAEAVRINQVQSPVPRNAWTKFFPKAKRAE